MYKNYQNARNAAWRILLDCGIDRLPVNLNVICKHLGVRTLSYQRGAGIIQHYGLEGIAAKTDGMALYVGTQPLILFDGSLYPQRMRFTTAHELGHIVLRHIAPRDVTQVNREPQPTDALEETAANQFAARLLAPACVLWGLDVHTAEEIAQLCRISKQAAEFRAARMAELYQRDKFLSSPLERAVYQRFLPFIKEGDHRQG